MVGLVKQKDHALPDPPSDSQAVNAAQIIQAREQDEKEKAALNETLQRNAQSGARVMEFDENATPEQKAALAKKAADQIKPLPGLQIGPGAKDQPTGMTSDIGGKHVDATLDLTDVDKASKLEGQAGDGKNLPGAIPAGQATSTLPEWYQVGWTGVAHRMKGLAPGQAVSTEEQVHLDLISTFLSDAYYGFFWYNGAVIAIAILATYFATRFGGGFFSLVVIGAFCSTYYNTSMRRTRQRARDDLTRELAKKKMMSEHETADWINHFLSRFWLIYEPVLSATIIQTVDQILVAQCPAFLDSIRMTTFTLGTKAPRIDQVRTFPQTDDDVVMMDWKFSFTPNDTADLTVRQAAQKINPKIVLTVRLGRGVVGAGMPILVEDISFVGNMRIKMKLMSNFPHIQIVDVSFMEPPLFDYVLKPIGGNTFGFDIGNIPGLSDFIQGQVHANLGPMMYNPNVFTINLEELLSGTPLDTACGVLQVTIWSARNLKAVKLGGGTPDPYVNISIDNKETLAKTRTKKSTANPHFKDTHFVLLNNLNGMLTFSLMDFNEHRPDSNIGQAAFELKELEGEAEHENLSTPVMLDGKERGQVQYSLSYYPVIKPEVGEDGQPKPLPETRSGVVRLTLHQAKELDKRSGFVGELNPKARIKVNGQKVKDTPVVKRTNSPIFEMPTEFLVTDRGKAVVTVEILDDRDLRADPVVAYLSVKLDDLLAAKEKQQDWFPLKNSKLGRIRMSAEWKPVLMSGSMNGGSGYSPAIGVVKFWMKKATDVKNVEAVMGGKSDPYVQVKIRGQAMDGSTIVNNNLNPEWNEILYCPVHNLREKITVEVMDYQNSGKDRTLGTVELNVSELATEKGDVDGRYKYASTGRKTRADKIHLGRGLYKGEIFFDCEFLPGVNLAGVEFSGAGNEAAQKAKVADDSDDSSSLSSSDDEVVAEPAGKGAAAPTATNGATKGHSKNQESITSMASMATAETSATTDTVKKREDGVSMSKEELLSQQSGVIAFNVLSGTLPPNKKNAQLEVLFDDGYWPAYTTEKGRSQHCTWDEVGESTVRELDWSRFLLKLRTGDSDEDVFAEFAGNTKDVLEKTLDGPFEFKLKSSAGVNVATVQLACRYIPVDVHIEPVESVNNQGYLRVDVIKARNLRAADRGNRSDPYITFSLNGERLGKSKVVKKTLNPDFNENLGEFQVPSRVAAEAIVEAFDWDQVGTPDKLGQCRVDLAELEPFEPFEKTYPLEGKGSTEKSEVTLRFVFRPEFVTNRERKGTSLSRTFTSGVAGVGRLGAGGVKGVAQGGVAVGKAGFGVGKGVVGGVGKGVGKGVGGVGSLLRSGHKSNGSVSNGTEAPIMEEGAGGEMVGATQAFGSGTEGLPTSSSFGVPMPTSAETGAYHLAHDAVSTTHLAGKANDGSSMMENDEGTPTKSRKSRIHNPFKRHN
ncbi:tricalbin [Violaceomyces palustris]|uniref:Tricalbin n=1 Tax=Violaceomyces palustris TaxID=1673888 RepID=A0ACD0NW30_9BASI|nr:tricalbin [Violaceomyces palustris]